MCVLGIVVELGVRTGIESRLGLGVISALGT